MDSIYLVDSGGQYPDGTTDVTRTVVDRHADGRDEGPLHPRPPGPYRASPARASRKGRAARSSTASRASSSGSAGLDYAHGTGHGVGSFLSVHEGPQRISPVGSAQPGGDEPLKAGMILSNEPGYYKTGEYGIRIENLVLVVPVEVGHRIWLRLHARRNRRAAARLCMDKGLRFHVDGARFANAVASLGCSPADLSWRAGVDALSFGFTKNGGLSAEALILFDPALAAETHFRRKRAGHLLSKGRYLAAQILAMLEGGVWLRNARAANEAASRLAAAAGPSGCSFRSRPMRCSSG